MVRSILFLISLSLLSSISYGDVGHCIDKEGSVETNLKCFEGKLSSAELDQQRALRVVKSEISSDDKRQKFMEKLTRSEESWLSYRNNHCMILSSFKINREDKQIELLQCKVTLTKLRADELRALVPNEDTCGCTSHSLDKIQFKTPISTSDE